MPDELDRLTSMARQAQLSASLQAARAAAFGGEAHALRQQVRTIRASFFWRLTTPLRLAIDLARGGPEAYPLRRAISLARAGGLRHAAERGRAWRRVQRQVAIDTAPLPNAPAALLAGYETKSTRDPATTLAPRVLIIGELSLLQCAKYRVWQKQELLARLGIPCTVVDWRDISAALTQAALATQVILYRVPYFPAVIELVAGLRRLNVRLAFEVDDLIFNRELFLQNRNIESLDAELREGIISGVDLYRDALRACDWGIASTEALAQAMRGAGLAEVAVVENALDEETLRAAVHARAVTQPHEGVVIAYGSGTKTHNADFAEAAPALLEVLRLRPSVRLRIIGELDLSPDFAIFAERIERLPPMPYAAYLECLASSDISLAPLEPTLFNDAKSNIKFLEAAVVGVPSICSPRETFRAVLRDGENGRLAEDTQSWREALLTLVDDPALRQRLGEAALAATLDRYAPEAIAQHQLAPLFAATDRRPAKRLRVLFANIYFAPRSYGGATVVVEEMASRLAARGDTEVFVVTGLAAGASPRVLRRYEHGRVTVFALPLSEGSDSIGEFDNPVAGDQFGAILDAVQPDVVHLHSVQWIGAGAALACRTRTIPYVITLHDCWWVCARQFMVTPEDRYCGQTTIDLRLCEPCTKGMKHLPQRQALLAEVLRGAALLLSPSEAHRRLYLANGIAPERIVVAPNGVRLASGPIRKPPRDRVRFGYVGGVVAVKGFPLVRAAFEQLRRDDWELVLVDNTQALGLSTMDAASWRVRGHIEILPAYTQENLDEFFAGIDVLLFPSQWKESFGLTVREALARDVWVIATAGGGAGEALTEGVNGTLLPLDGDPRHLAAAMEAILEDAPRYLHFVNPCKSTIADYAAQAEALHATLAGIAARHAQGGSDGPGAA